MADIHPNDIGLATYEDVGDVEKLKTAAKVVVDAINELYSTGGGGSSGGSPSGGGSANGNTQGFEQIYVDGENNIIIGENNIVYGNNNLIIGSDNVINADNLNFIIDAATDTELTVLGMYFNIYYPESFFSDKYIFVADTDNRKH